MNEEKWWTHPQGIVAALAILTTVLGFFYIRERQLWEDKVAIESLETRGGAAILESKASVEKLHIEIDALRREVWELEKRLKSCSCSEKEAQ